jgi:hypothetical protein
MKENQDKSEIYASFNIIRVGKRYKLINFGETNTFEVLEINTDDDCVVRSLDTLETYNLLELVRYGKGEDFDFEEI